jgi:hypothetical protein
MRSKTVLLAAAVFSFLPTLVSLGQDNTSRLIPFSLSTFLPPETTQEVVVELWDASSGGTLVFSESYVGPAALVVDSTGAISFLFGSLQVPPGLNPDDFPSGSSRYLDVTQAGASVLTARVPLTAMPFALSPGPQGPTGATGPTGPSGPNDVVGNLTMVHSTATAGNILKGGARFLHNFGPNNTFLGINAGNFTMSGVNNTGIGVSALRLNTTGEFNTASGVSALQFNTTGANNTAIGLSALQFNTTGYDNTASGASALLSNTTGANNTAAGDYALASNTTGFANTALGVGADVSLGNLSNATAIGATATVNASNKVRVGNAFVTVIEGQVGFTASSDVHQKENFQPVDKEEVLGKLRGLRLTTWNFIGHDPKQFRHYGPMAQDFFAAFGHDGIGQIGTETTITSTDMDGILMIAAQALERRAVKQQNRIGKQERRSANQDKQIAALRAENAELKARLEVLERRVGNTAFTRAE